MIETRSAIELRAVTEPADVAALRSVFTAVSGEQFLAAGLADALIEQLTESQFAAQQASYSAQHPASVDHLIMLDGQPVGRCWIERTATVVHVLDLAVVPAFRRRAIARDVLLELVAVAGERAVTLEVWAQNEAALALYGSLGFVTDAVTGSDAHGYVALRRDPLPELTR